MVARRFLGIGLAGLMTAFALHVPVPPAGAQECIASGDQDKINEVLTEAGRRAVLCSGAVFSLSAPVKFTAPRQEITTEANATSPATLRIVGKTQTTAVDGERLDGVILRNVVVDGNYRGLGDLADGVPRDPLVKMGAADAQVVRDNRIIDPRGWSAVHFYEGDVTGDVPQCQHGRIIGNQIGPAGLDDPVRQKWADGISLACGRSLVSGNTVTDATDGAIVVFGAPGSVIENNTVVAETRQLLGGINLVDFEPMNGNYTGTVVRGNVIDAKSAYIKIGVAMGLQVWGCRVGTVRGATVTGNTLRGLHMGYGYAVNGVEDWTVTGNADESRHVGLPAGDCGGPVSDPAGFQVQATTGNSVLQGEFTSARLTWALGITEPGILQIGRAPAGCTWLEPDEALFPGRHQLSCDGRFKLTLQLDGNLVLTVAATGQVLWASGTGGRRSAVALMQQDGNFVIYDSAGRPTWSSDSGGRSGAHLAVQDDGNVVVYTRTGGVLWTSNTGGH